MEAEYARSISRRIEVKEECDAIRIRCRVQSHVFADLRTGLNVEAEEGGGKGRTPPNPRTAFEDQR